MSCERSGTCCKQQTHELQGNDACILPHTATQTNWLLFPCRQYPLCNITVHWEQLGYEAGLQANVRDLFAEKDLGIYTGSFTATVDVHDAATLKISPVVHQPHHRSWRPWQGTLHDVLKGQAY